MKARCVRTGLKRNYLDEKITMKRALPHYLFHKSAISNRTSIICNGLLPKIGISYFCHWDCRPGLKPLIFLYDRNVLEYDTTYDDDIYRIDVSKLDKREITEDPDKCMKGCYVYNKSIPPAYCEIIYKGSGLDTF